MIRLRPNVAWALRGLAKRLNALAERCEPIKISTASPRPTTYLAGLPLYDMGKPVTRLPDSTARSSSSPALTPMGTAAGDRRRFSSSSRGKR